MTGRLVSLVDYLGKLSCCTKSSGTSWSADGLYLAKFLKCCSVACGRVWVCETFWIAGICGVICEVLVCEIFWITGVFTAVS